MGIICIVSSVAWPLMLEITREWSNSRIRQIAVILLTITVIAASFFFPYLAVGSRPSGLLETRWLGYFLATGFLITEGFATLNGVSIKKRVLSVAVAAVVGFFVLSRATATV